MVQYEISKEESYRFCLGEKSVVADIGNKIVFTFLDDEREKYLIFKDMVDTYVKNNPGCLYRYESDQLDEKYIDCIMLTDRVTLYDVELDHIDQFIQMIYTVMNVKYDILNHSIEIGSEISLKSLKYSFSSDDND